ncbi:MAG: ribonuclease H family protein [Flavobacteriales bacterium]|jgi:ribonuclease HI|nr:ribonuclease H family protein [Flavobacteriales bacterium]
MAKKSKKFYVVWEGHTPGIYENWNTCKKQIEGFAEARYKSFKSQAEAQTAFEGRWQDYWGKDTKPSYQQENKDWIDLVGLPDGKALTVDAACSGNPGKMEYRAVNMERQKEIFRVGPLDEGTNNVGEFLAIVHALAHIEKTKEHYGIIYSDSKIAMRWVLDKVCRTKLSKTSKNQKLWDLIYRAEKYLRTHDWPAGVKIKKWETKYWGEIPADFGRK